jgi:hypothetical protein
MSGNSNDPRLLRLHPVDNVLTVIRALEAGERIVVEWAGGCL